MYPYYYGMNAYKATVGLATEFNIKRSFFTQYNTWPFQYSECTVTDENNELMRPLDDPYLYDVTITQLPSTTFGYTRHTCYELCYQEGLAEYCNCSQYSIKMQVRANLTMCLPPMYGECEQTYRETKYYNDQFFYTNCMLRCPLECHKKVLEFTPYSYLYSPLEAVVEKEFTAAGASELWRLRANQSEFQKNRAQNVLRLVFYYDSLSYLRVEEEPKVTLDALIGTIGGHLHLFLGMSLLSFVEIAVLGLKFFYALCA